MQNYKYNKQAKGKLCKGKLRKPRHNTMANSLGLNSSNTDPQPRTYTPKQIFTNYLTLLDPADEKLIDIDKVVTYADRYIASYNCDQMQQYKRLFKIIYQKYNNKKHKITNTSDKLEVYNISNDDTLISIKKPVFKNVLDEIHRMTDARQLIKDALDYEYDKLIRMEKPDAKLKIHAESLKNEYVDLLTKLYVYKLYHAKINEIINTGNEYTIVRQHLKPSVSYGVFNESQPLLDAHSYRINKTIINELNKYNSDKLDLMNNIKLNLKQLNSKNKTITKETYEMITKYLDKTHAHEIEDKLQTAAHTQDNAIKIIILELPEIDDKALSLI